MRLLRSLRSRLIASHAVVVLVALLTAGLTLGVLLDDYQRQLAEARLIDVAVPLTVQFRGIAQRGGLDEGLAFLEDQARVLGVRILVLGPAGRVLADTSTEQGQRSQSLPALRPDASRRLPRDRPYMVRSFEDGGRTWLVVVVPAPGPRPGAALAVARSEDQLASPLPELLSRLGLASLAGLGVAILLGTLLAAAVHRPVQRLAGAAQEVARGRYDARVPVKGPTELAELSASFNQMAVEVGRSQRILRDFVANVSHELKTPLTAIRGFIQAVLDGTAASEAERRHGLEIADREVRRLQALVARLLELSRLEARQVALGQDPVELDDVLRTVADIFAVSASERQIYLELDCPLPLVALGDADRLEQVFTNLVDNALSHTPKGGRVAIRTWPEKGPRGDVARVAVEDEGPGVPADQLPHVFERFFRVEGGHRPGVGLGLAIAREIVWAHGGTIEAENLPERGARFLVTLPMVRTED